MRYNESCTNGALHMMDETEQKIMNAAAALFAEKGLRFTMQELASSLHMSKKSIYKLYDNKICTGDEAAECRFCMQKRMESIGYRVVTDRGDYKA